jgi:predicted O-methyltransferase YrrM
LPASDYGEIVVMVRQRPQRSRRQKLTHLLRTFAADPVAVGRALPGEFRQRHGSARSSPAQLDDAWFEHLHGLLGAAWPCPEPERLDVLMRDIAGLLSARGLGSGRGTFGGWYSDAETFLCQAMWCTVMHTRPEVVVETGVAHGVSSRVLLEALRLNDHGHLWSIDLPHPLDSQQHADIGVAVTEECRAGWTFLAGSSRQRLPSLVAEVGHVDLFIHDSLHTARNTLFEMEQVAPALPRGGVMIVDDVNLHDGFAAFAHRHPEYQTIVCEALDAIGTFGIAVKTAAPAEERPALAESRPAAGPGAPSPSEFQSNAESIGIIRGRGAIE